MSADSLLMRMLPPSGDPDGNAVIIKWWQFQAGSYPGRVVITNPGSPRTEVLIPKDAADGQTIHMILEVSDNGTPPLTRYQRVIITLRNR